MNRYLLSVVSAIVFDAISAQDFDKSTLSSHRMFQRQQYALRFPLYPLLITGSNKLDRKMSRHDITIVDWDFEYQHKPIPVHPKVQFHYILEDFENASPYFCTFLAKRICD